MPKTAQQYTPPHDPYARSRCMCGHLVYADDTTPGHGCRYCPCDHHTPKETE